MEEGRSVVGPGVYPDVVLPLGSFLQATAGWAVFKYRGVIDDGHFSVSRRKQKGLRGELELESTGEGGQGGGRRDIRLFGWELLL